MDISLLFFGPAPWRDERVLQSGTAALPDGVCRSRLIVDDAGVLTEHGVEDFLLVLGEVARAVPFLEVHFFHVHWALHFA